MFTMTERDRADLVELVDLLYKLSIISTATEYEHAIHCCYTLFEKCGHYTNYN